MGQTDVAHKVNFSEAVDKQSHPTPCSITGVISTINGAGARGGGVGTNGSGRSLSRTQTNVTWCGALIKTIIELTCETHPPFRHSERNFPETPLETTKPLSVDDFNFVLASTLRSRGKF